MHELVQIMTAVSQGHFNEISEYFVPFTAFCDGGRAGKNYLKVLFVPDTPALLRLKFQHIYSILN